MPLALPAVDRPARPEGGLERGELLQRRLGARMLVPLEPCHGNELVREATGLLRFLPAPLGAQREGVLLLA